MIGREPGWKAFDPDGHWWEHSFALHILQRWTVDLVRDVAQWPARRRERKLHNDRDYGCRYWWGDRGGYDLANERCLICNPLKPGGCDG